MLEFDAMKKGKTLVVGHRGAYGYAPENTMPSFEKGLKCGSDLLELDIHESFDGELVVMHDSEVDRTTDGTGPIENMTISQIKKLDAGIKFDIKFKDTRVPLLRELLDWAHDRIPLVIEIKGNPFPAPGIEQKLIRMLKEYNIIAETMVISFHHECMKRFKETEPALATGLLLMGELIDPLHALKSCNSNSWRPGWQYWTKEKAELVQHSGATASTWNADIESVMDKIVPMGLASIGSNFPDRLRNYIDKCGRDYK